MTRMIINRLAAWCIRGYLWIVIKTSRVEIEGLDELHRSIHNLHNANGNPIIIAVWHNKLFLLPYIVGYLAPRIPTSAVISKSRDGDIPSALATSFDSVDVIRIGHKSRHRALQEIVHTLQQKKIILITPDGPRGPCYEVKPGVVFASKRCHAKVFPYTWNCSSTITLKSWDRFQIPLPFSKMKVIFKKPLEFADEEHLETGCIRLKQALDSLKTT